MGFHIKGKCLGVSTQERGDEDRKFTVTLVHILDGVHIDRVELTRDFRGPLPVEGTDCDLDVYVFPWKAESGNLGLDVKAYASHGALARPPAPAGEKAS